MDIHDPRGDATHAFDVSENDDRREEKLVARSVYMSRWQRHQQLTKDCKHRETIARHARQWSMVDMRLMEIPPQSH